MSLGLKRGTVKLEPHDPAWEAAAAQAIAILHEVLGDAAGDVQHVGSTAVPSIAAKPIVDIALAAKDQEAVASHDGELARRGIVFRQVDRDADRLYVMGEGEERTHHIHVVPEGSESWKNYIAFRDYLNANPDAARRYCALKQSLAERHADDREAYTQGKAALIERLLAEARNWQANGTL